MRIRPTFRVSSDTFRVAVSFLNIIILVCGISLPATGQTHIVLYSFLGGSDGLSPNGVVGDAGGNLYGTTYTGGAYNLGTVFKLDANGTETVIHAFKGGRDGARPGAVILDPRGRLYGATNLGGFSDAGTVFEVNVKTGAYQVLYRFAGGLAGSAPRNLTHDDAGNLYGEASGGAFNGGMLFKLDPNGVMSVVFDFDNVSAPMMFSPLWRDAAGNFYGTAAGGIPECNGLPCGTVAELQADGTYLTLYTFPSGGAGCNPYGVVRDKSGNLYGTTHNCGAQNQGLIYKLDTAGTEFVLHTFTQKEGGYPETPLIWGEGANVYGTTEGGTHRQGKVFKLNVQMGWYKVLYSFTGGADGSDPSGLWRDSAGTLYGTTASGGTYGNGTIFLLKP